MKIVGINSQFDAGMNKIAAGSAALIVDGQIRMALAEDRISRVKYDGGYKHALTHILKEEGLTLEDIDYFYISFYGNPMIPNDDVVAFHLKDLELEDCPDKLVVVQSHHLSHAALAFFLSPFDEALIMVADNEGSLTFSKDSRALGTGNNHCERNSYYWARRNSISFIERDFEHAGNIGFGKAYNKFNRVIGFGSYHTAGKTMGLSAYTRIVPEFESLDLWSMDENGKLKSLIPETYDSHTDVKAFFKQNGIAIQFFDEPDAYDRQEYKDLAGFVQKQLNKWSLEKLKFLSQRSGFGNICTSGGVALNGVMNAHLQSYFGVDKVFAPPFPSDPGQGLGNAILGYLEKSGASANPLLPKVRFENFAYLGTEFDKERVESALSAIGEGRATITRPVHILKDVAKLLASGKIVGFFQGRSEYGARALGNRSVLAMPNSVEIRDKVNVLKGRELFRPLAPSILSEYVDEYFEGGRSLLDPYMLGVSVVRPEKRMSVEGIVHVDGTARIQEITRRANERYYDLIQEYFKISGIPMVMNTSFNLADEPIVETPEQAITSFFKMGLDALLIEHVLILRG
jgi:carbamoyltransferase